jgi:hypothetical protein
MMVSGVVSVSGVFSVEGNEILKLVIMILEPVLAHPEESVRAT